MKDNAELIRRTMQIISEIRRKTTGSISYCRRDMEWHFNHLHGYGVSSQHVRTALKNSMNRGSMVKHYSYRVQRISEHVQMVSGLFCVMSGENEVKISQIPYEVVVCMENGQATSIYIYSSNQPNQCLQVRGYNEVVYFPEADEILYLEAARNHVIWHCRDYEIEGRGPLKQYEEKLPEQFIRIQRGYIINTRHLRSIRRNEVEMDNGDVLPVPYRIFMDVRESVLVKKNNTRNCPE